MHRLRRETTSIPSTLMASGEEITSSEVQRNERLRNLVEQLQSYQPALIEKEENREDVEVDSDISLPESTTKTNLLPTKATEGRAAVLVCLFEGDKGELRVILTKRSRNLSKHPGEVALPGGKREGEDKDDTATALREAKEEIGLDSSLVHVVTLLEPFISEHLLTVVPVVALLPQRDEFKQVINTDEVDTIFDAPLEMFLKVENHRCEERECKGLRKILHLFDYESEQGKFCIGGLTAGILIRVASIIYQQTPPFKKHILDFQGIQRASMADG